MEPAGQASKVDSAPDLAKLPEQSKAQIILQSGHLASDRFAKRKLDIFPQRRTSCYVARARAKAQLYRSFISQVKHVMQFCHARSMELITLVSYTRGPLEVVRRV